MLTYLRYVKTEKCIPWPKCIVYIAVCMRPCLIIFFFFGLSLDEDLSLTNIAHLSVRIIILYGCSNLISRVHMCCENVYSWYFHHKIKNNLINIVLKTMSRPSSVSTDSANVNVIHRAGCIWYYSRKHQLSYSHTISTAIFSTLIIRSHRLCSFFCVLVLHAYNMHNDLIDDCKSSSDIIVSSLNYVCTLQYYIMMNFLTQ